MANEWVIRVVQFNRDGLRSDLRQHINSLWLEQMRYMNLIHWHVRDEQMADPTRSGEYVYKQVFDLYAPKHVAKTASQAWARKNAERMRSFGINAVAAPIWAPGQTTPMKDVSPPTPKAPVEITTGGKPTSKEPK